MSNTTDILNLSVVELRDAVASGSVSAVQAVRAYVEAVSARDGAIGAYIDTFAERSLKRAAAVDAARSAGLPMGPMAGVPVAVADNICTDFGRTTCGSKLLENFRSPYSASAVAKLEAAGAIVLGKANLDEFGIGSSTEHNGVASPTRNPWDVSRVPGGHGAAAAVAGRMAAAAIGGDTGGAVRQSAAYCGLVGLRPTYGRVSRFGLAEYASSLDQIGPMTRDVSDTALLLSVLAGRDENDATSSEQPVPDFLAGLDAACDKPLRIGVPEESFFLDIDIKKYDDPSGMESRLADARDALQAAGAIIVPLRHSRADEDSRIWTPSVMTMTIIAMAEASSNLARFGGMHFDRRTDKPCSDVHDLYARSRAEGFGDETKLQIMLGTHILTAGLYETYYTKALQLRRMFRDDSRKMYKLCDVVLEPVTTSPAYRLGETGDPLRRMCLDSLFTCGASLTGLPAMSVPIGMSDTGLPVAMQLTAPAFREDLLLRAARMYEKQTGMTRLKPPCA